jgi:hypothetical protein
MSTISMIGGTGDIYIVDSSGNETKLGFANDIKIDAVSSNEKHWNPPNINRGITGKLSNTKFNTWELQRIIAKQEKYMRQFLQSWRNSKRTATL